MNALEEEVGEGFTIENLTETAESLGSDGMRDLFLTIFRWLDALLTILEIV